MNWINIIILFKDLFNILIIYVWIIGLVVHNINALINSIKLSLLYLNELKEVLLIILFYLIYVLYNNFNDQ